MTQEEKELLLKDLCARLPYGVKFKITATSTKTLRSIGIGRWGLILINLFYKKPEFYLINEFGRLEYKPYLRSMSSMTDEEKREYDQIRYDPWHSHYDEQISSKMIDWLNKKMFDHRGLIPMGLALEAPKDMYKKSGNIL